MCWIKIKHISRLPKTLQSTFLCKETDCFFRLDTVSLSVSTITSGNTATSDCNFTEKTESASCVLIFGMMNTEIGEQRMRENYEKNLKAKEYNEKFNRIFNQIRGNFEFILQFLHDVIKSGRFTGSKVLDIGSGATVHNIASASSRFSNIVQTDYVMDNVEELRRWHEGKSTLDWSQFLNVVVNLERKDGYSTATLEELESRIRKSVRCVVQGDLLSDTVLPLDDLKAQAAPPYDLVISVLCIETVALDFDGYVAILKRVNALLRKGGGILVCGYENGSPWIIGENKFNHVKLNLEQISNAFQEAGFGKLDMNVKEKSKSEYNYEYDSLFCVAAEKL